MKVGTVEEDCFTSLVKLREMESRRIGWQDTLLKELRTKFTRLDGIHIDGDGFSINTKHHTVTGTTYSSGDQHIPTFVCSGVPNMPNTVEEFKAMQDEVAKDKQECMTLYFYVKFRYLGLTNEEI